MQLSKKSFATAIGAPKKKSTMKLLFTGAVIGGLVGGGYSAYDSIGKKKASRDELATTILDSKPDVPIMRRIENPKDNTGLDIVLFQFQTCPFCW